MEKQSPRIIWIKRGIITVFLFTIIIGTMPQKTVQSEGNIPTTSLPLMSNNLQSFAPANLTAIIVSNTELQNKGFNQTVTYFIQEWTRIFGKDLLKLNVTESAVNGSLNATQITYLNNSLVIGNARTFLDASWPAASPENMTVLTPWYNGTFGWGWAIYGGSLQSTVRALAFYGSMISKVRPWTQTILAPRFPFLLGGAYWGSILTSYESTLKSLVQRGYNSFQIDIPIDTICNFSLPGYSDPVQQEGYVGNLTKLKTFIDLAADYGIQLYIYTDELVLTEVQYNYLLSHLNYTGPADRDYPGSLSGEAPGLWQFITEKYNRIIDSLATIVSPSNQAGFGGFYFRIDDLSNNYYHTYAIFRQDKYLQRFINITTAAAARINASIIQRMWRLGEEESSFNNATLAKALLDPINATNLILRCKETWNDHWLNHPPNPVIGVSHHPWIIGWYVGAALPDYKGKYFDELFTNSSWISNPNVIGYDSAQIAYASFQRLDYNPFESMNTHHLMVKAWYGETFSYNETVKLYLNQIGFTDDALITNLTEIFVKSHDVFRELSFFMAWSTTGKFRGDVLNGGNTVLFEPGRFNMFYDTMQTSNYSNEYTIQEGFRARDLAIALYASFPTEVPGYGKLPDLNVIKKDPQYAVDPTNLTEQLATLRGNFRHFADFARFFAEYRAWHMTFYEWGATSNPVKWVEAEQYRKNVISTYYEYKTVWNDTNYWYQTQFGDFDKYWLPVEGQMDTLRWIFGLCLGILCVSIWIFYATYRKYPKYELKSVLFGRLFTKRSKKAPSNEPSNKNTALSSKSLIKFNLIVGVLLPGLALYMFWLLLYAMVNGIYAALVLIIVYLLLSLFLGVRLSVVILSNRNELPKVGLGYFGNILFITTFAIICLVGGIYGIIASKFLAAMTVGAICIAFVWSACLLMRNIQFHQKWKQWLFVPLSVVLMVIIFSLITLYQNGPIEAINNAITFS